MAEVTEQMKKAGAIALKHFVVEPKARWTQLDALTLDHEVLLGEVSAKIYEAMESHRTC